MPAPRRTSRFFDSRKTTLKRGAERRGSRRSASPAVLDNPGHYISLPMTFGRGWSPVRTWTGRPAGLNLDEGRWTNIWRQVGWRGYSFNEPIPRLASRLGAASRSVRLPGRQLHGAGRAVRDKSTGRGRRARTCRPARCRAGEEPRRLRDLTGPLFILEACLGRVCRPAYVSPILVTDKIVRPVGEDDSQGVDRDRCPVDFIVVDAAALALADQAA